MKLIKFLKVKVDSESIISSRRLHPQNRANGPSREDGRGHLVPHTARLTHILRSEAGYHGEPRVDVSARTLQPPRRSAQTWHRADEATQGRDPLCVVVSQTEMLVLTLC